MTENGGTQGLSRRSGRLVAALVVPLTAGVPLMVVRR
jgi:hypothetical protein